MSKVDDVFASIAPALVNEWGHEITFIRTRRGNYDKDTGRIIPDEQRTRLKAVITKLKPQELQGVLQATDVKIIPDPTPLGDEPISETDFFEYLENGERVRAKVIQVNWYRGERPVAFVCMARPQ